MERRIQSGKTFVWKFPDFSVTQILREMNFWGCRSAKNAISTHLEDLNFDFHEILNFLKAESVPIIKIQGP